VHLGDQLGQRLDELPGRLDHEDPIADRILDTRQHRGIPIDAVAEKRDRDIGQTLGQRLQGNPDVVRASVRDDDDLAVAEGLGEPPDQPRKNGRIGNAILDDADGADRCARQIHQKSQLWASIKPSTS
jgi:hypothetical protein